MSLLDFGDQGPQSFGMPSISPALPSALRQTSVGVPRSPIASASRLLFSSNAGALSEAAKRKFW